jgi:AraC-like DNA-binding protein
MNLGTVSSDLIRVLLNYASSTNIPLDEAFGSMNFETKDLENTDSRISIINYLLVWKTVQEKSKDINFGLHYGEETSDLFKGNILCTIMMNCPDIGEAIKKFIRYYCLMSDLTIPQIRQQEDQAFFTLHSAANNIDLNIHLSNSLMIMLLAVLRCLSGNKVNIIDVQFKHSSPNNLNEYHRIFGSTLSFEKDEYSIVFEKEILSKPIFLANHELLNTMEPVAERLLERLLSSRLWTNKVIEIISRKLTIGECPDIGSIAGSLTTSIRNLQYRLHEEGTSYQILLNRVRKEFALNYINKPSVTLYDISFLLGFSEQSSFNHAFKKWTGIKPTEYRKKLFLNGML